ncbi:hypothetical protein I3843_07G076100 [Carya illinoinensis]|nr:hypothetical protein I3843_07G076100 [Carya illinoinensis]
MEAAEYFSKDFEWEELRAEVENDPSLRCHLLPFESSNHSSIKAADEDSAAWKRFHVRHSSGKFFKERRYLLKEFPELVSCGEHYKVLEVGCGNGSTALPILRGNEHIIVYACDCSTETLERAEEIIAAANVASVRHRFHTFCCDFSTTGFPEWLGCHTCQEIFLQKQQICLSGFDFHPSHCCVLLLSPYAIYTSDFFFASPDVKENNRNDAYSLKERHCCIGGVDFVTLVCILFPKIISSSRSLVAPGCLCQKCKKFK